MIGYFKESLYVIGYLQGKFGGDYRGILDGYLNDELDVIGYLQGELDLDLLQP